MFAYCNNNPINNADPAGQSPLLIAIAGGAFGGAMVGLLFSHKNDLSLGDTLITMLGGAIAGGFGAAAGILSGVPQVLCTLFATLTSGLTVEATGGEFGIGLVIGFVGTILGTKIPTASFTGADLFWGNAVATAAVGIPSEMASQSMHKDFEALQEILDNESRSCAGGGSSLPLGLRGMGTGAA